MSKATDYAQKMKDANDALNALESAAPQMNASDEAGGWLVADVMGDGKVGLNAGALSQADALRLAAWLVDQCQDAPAAQPDPTPAAPDASGAAGAAAPASQDAPAAATSSSDQAAADQSVAQPADAPAQSAAPAPAAADAPADQSAAPAPAQAPQT